MIAAKKNTILQKFKNSLHRGTGEAYVIMKSNPSIDFSDALIWAAKKNLSYDNQSEGSRAEYVYGLIMLSQQKKKIKRAVLKALDNEVKDTWALVQLFDIASLFAKGDAEAKKAMYKRYYNKSIAYSDWVGESALISVDGLKALLYIAEVKGKEIYKNSDIVEDSYLVDSYQANNPNINVYEELKKASEKNKYIKSYLESIIKNKDRVSKRVFPKFNYEYVKQRMKNKAGMPLTKTGAKDLSNADIKKLADDFLIEKNHNQIEKYAAIFRFVKFPYDYKILLKFVKKPDNSINRRLIGLVSEALQYFTDDDIRLIALKKLRKTNFPDIYLHLLVSNYKVGYAKLLSAIVDKYKNMDKIHSLVWGIIDIYKTNKVQECVGPLTALYDKINCGIHRKEVIRIMLDNHVLPKQIENEMQYDSYSEIREIYSQKNDKIYE